MKMAENIRHGRSNVKCVMLNAFGDHDCFEVSCKDMADRKVKVNEIVVKVVVCGMNFADVYTRQGLPTGAQNALKPPFVCGLECAGIVDEIGEDVTNFQVGDRVMCFKGVYGGMWSEYVFIEDCYCYKFSDEVTWKDAGALLINYCTAYCSLFSLGNLGPGDSIYIDSAGGGVGWAATQLARTVNNITIYGAASKHKHEAIKKNGVDHAIDYTETNYMTKLQKLSNECGLDLIVDMQSGKKFSENFKLLNSLGRIVHVGGFEMVSGNTMSIWKILRTWWDLKNVRVIDLIQGNTSVAGFNLSNLVQRQPSKLKEIMDKIIELYSAGKIKPKIHEIYSFEKVVDASKTMGNRENVGKILITPAIDSALLK